MYITVKACRKAERRDRSENRLHRLATPRKLVSHRPLHIALPIVPMQRKVLHLRDPWEQAHLEDHLALHISRLGLDRAAGDLVSSSTPIMRIGLQDILPVHAAERSHHGPP
jgi:hypothetical protein